VVPQIEWGEIQVIERGDLWITKAASLVFGEAKFHVGNSRAAAIIM
jgi:hypothetical protein